MSKTYIPDYLRKLVEERANGNCEYCLLPALFSGSIFCIDHILPESKSGLTVFENLAYACHNCNSFKSAKIEGFDDLSKIIAPIFNPRIHIWSEHFVFNNQSSIITGITSIGRVTTNSLKMNEIAIQNLRKALVNYDVFPPENF